MKKIELLLEYTKIANLHAERLEAALSHTKALLPLSAEALATLSDEAAAFLDMTTTRFGKLQDVLRRKIFPLILETLKEDDAISFRDKLNRLEKLGFINDAHWWDELRDIRNKLTHEYPDSYELLANDFNRLAPIARELLLFWQNLQEKLIALTALD